MSARPCREAEETRRRLAARLEESISAAESRALKAHLAECGPCAAEALRRDPTLLFAPLAAAGAERAESGEARRMAADVLAAVEVERARRRLARPVRRAVLRAASVALLAGALVALVKLAGRPGAPVAGPVVHAPAASAPAAAPAPPAAAPFTIEDLKNPGATVYQFASTSVEEPNVVFVVDRNLEL